MIAQGAATMFDYIVVAVGIIILIHLLPRVKRMGSWWVFPSTDPFPRSQSSETVCPSLSDGAWAGGADKKF